MDRPRVLIWALLGDGGAGGVQTVISGLAQGFRELGDPGVDLTWLTKAGDDEWLCSQIPDTSTVVHVEERHAPARRLGSVWRRLGMTSESLGISSAWVPRRFAAGLPFGLAQDDFDLIHFPTQSAFYTNLPFIYQPHDLQHEHLPQYFTRSQIAWRRMFYRANICSAAATVVGSEFIARDIERVYPKRQGEVLVVPLAPVSLPSQTGNAEGIDERLPAQFAFYPAAAWPHKNHETLFHAIRLLKNAGKVRPIVLTGAHAGGVDLTSLAGDYGISDLVTHLGYVDPGQLARLYDLALFVVIPTTFEAGSFPMFEAFQSGCPVLASNVCSLPAQSDGAAVLFDPRNPSELAKKIDEMWIDQPLRASLTQRGFSRANEFSWRATATGFAAVYRHVLGLPPHPGDLNWQRTHARF